MSHFWFIVKHKWFVMIECFRWGLIYQGLVHDIDKFRIGYFRTYNRYRLSDKYKSQQPEVLYPRTGDMDMDREILRHRKRSPHHWQYYCYGRKKPSPMPDRYIKEMICDWIGSSKVRGRKNLMEWYSISKDYMVFDEKTRDKVEVMMSIYNLIHKNNG